LQGIFDEQVACFDEGMKIKGEMNWFFLLGRLAGAGSR
jgi:hypothetical protein